MALVDVSKEEHVKLFNTIALETGARCNRRCVFCPQYKSDRPNEFLPMELIQKIVEELVSIKYRGRLTTYIYNEPLLDKRIGSILEFIKRKLPKVCIMISTNGDMLKRKEDVDNLFSCGVSQLNINVYSSKERYTEICRWVREYDQKSSVYIYVKPGSRVVRVEKKFGNVGRSNFGRYELQNRSGNIPWFLPKAFSALGRMCVRPFRMLNINWKGEAILCCNDYHGIVKIGNVSKKSVMDLWYSYPFNLYRLFLCNKDRSLLLCRECDYRGGLFPHMVDKVTFGSDADKKLLGGRKEKRSIKHFLGGE